MLKPYVGWDSFPDCCSISNRGNCKRSFQINKHTQLTRDYPWQTFPPTYGYVLGDNCASYRQYDTICISFCHATIISGWEWTDLDSNTKHRDGNGSKINRNKQQQLSIFKTVQTVSPPPDVLCESFRSASFSHTGMLTNIFQVHEYTFNCFLTSARIVLSPIQNQLNTTAQSVINQLLNAYQINQVFNSVNDLKPKLASLVNSTGYIRQNYDNVIGQLNSYSGELKAYADLLTRAFRDLCAQFVGSALSSSCLSYQVNGDNLFPCANRWHLTFENLVIIRIYFILKFKRLLGHACGKCCCQIWQTMYVNTFLQSKYSVRQESSVVISNQSLIGRICLVMTVDI